MEVAGLRKLIRELEEKLHVLAENADPSSLVVGKKITELQCLLVKKDNEISFLKDTVRVECEERMGLVAMIANLQKPNSILSNHTQDAGKIEPKKERDPLKQALSGCMTNVDSKVETDIPLNSKDELFLKLFKHASAKNAKRLAKQSKSSLSNY